MWIYAHNENSEGAKNLAKALGSKRIAHTESKFNGSEKKIVINWGSRNLPTEVTKCRVLNPVHRVENASNKLNFFRDMAALGADGPRIPPFTSDPEVAKQWVRDKKLVVARTNLTGHSGAGIRFMEEDAPDSFVTAPLYVEYIKKKDEFRVHFVNGRLIDYQRKALRSGVDASRADWRVRNLDNGFVFVRNELTIPTDVTTQAQKVADTCGLDFGAIDIIWNEKSQQAFVLEVNTAPGLTGTTVENYAKAFKTYEA
jgi:glutathione synthase/RimK-type ligase-like ATP-grasp enzyme